MDIEKIVKVFIAIRDKKAEIKKAFEAEYEGLTAKQDLLEAQLLKYLQTSKCESFGTEYGTVFRQEDVKAGCSDWNAYWAWIKENDAFDGVEKRVGQGFVKDYIKDHEGAIPPGISVYREYVARVRRS